MINGVLDHTQECLIGELLKAGAVYEQEYVQPVNYERYSNQQPMQQNRIKLRFNDPMSTRCNQFVEASSANINVIM